MKKNLVKFVAGFMAAAVAFTSVGLGTTVRAAYTNENISLVGAGPDWSKAVELKSNQEVKDTLKAGIGKESKIYKFVMPKNGKFNLNISKDAASDSLSVKVYKGQYTSAINRSDYMIWQGQMGKLSNNTNNLASPSFAPKAGAEYYIEVENESIQAVHFAIKITYMETVSWEVESNDDMESANQLKSGKKLGGCLTNSADIDWYRFDMTNNGYATIRMDHNNKAEDKLAYDVEILDYKNNSYFKEQINNMNSTTQSGKIGLAKGVYYVRVKNNSGTNTGDYGITLVTKSDANFEREYNDTFETANTISLNKEMRGTTLVMPGKTSNHKDTYDYFKISVAKDTNVYLSLCHGTKNNSNTAWRVTLFNSDKKTVNKEFDVYNNKKYNGTGLFLLKKGTYYIRIYNWDKCDAKGQDYTLTVNSKLAATKLTAKLVKGKKKAVNVTWNKVNGSNGYVLYRATSKNGKYTAVKTVASNGKLSYKDTKVKKGKTYYYKVRAFKTVSGTREYGSYSAVKSLKVK